MYFAVPDVEWDELLGHDVNENNAIMPSSNENHPYFGEPSSLSSGRLGSELAIVLQNAEPLLTSERSVEYLNVAILSRRSDGCWELITAAIGHQPKSTPYI